MKKTGKIDFIRNFLLIVVEQLALKLALKIERRCAFGPNIPTSRRQGIFQVGPKKTQNYNPNYGYEPYWPGGDWVFERLETTTEKTEGFLCGNNCPDSYIEYGEVCGRSLNYTHKTFESYCDLLNEDCTGREKWLIAYRGKCQGDLKTYPTKHSELVTRAEKYIDDFDAKNPSKKRPKG